MMNIKIITSYATLAEEVCALLNDHGYKAEAHIVDHCASFEFRAAKYSEDEIEDIIQVQALLKPFHFKEIMFTDLNDGCDMEILFGSEDMHNHQFDIQIFAKTLAGVEKTHRQLSTAGLGVCTIGMSDVDAPKVIYGLNNYFAASYAAWISKMPPETMIQHSPEFGSMIALYVADELRTKEIRRGNHAITIRCSSEIMGQQFRDYLLGLGYNIKNLLILNSRLAHTEMFGLNLSCVDEQRSIQPDYLWLMSDLQSNVESWLNHQKVNLRKYPFEEIEMNFKNLYDSIVIDLPWDSYISGGISPYGFGFPGRYTTVIVTNNPEAAEPLAELLEEQAGMQEAEIYQEYDCPKHEIVFSGEVSNDFKAMEKIIHTVNIFMKEQKIPIKALNIRSTTSYEHHPVTIYFLFSTNTMSIPTPVESSNKSEGE